MAVGMHETCRSMIVDMLDIGHSTTLSENQQLKLLGLVDCLFEIAEPNSIRLVLLEREIKDIRKSLVELHEAILCYYNDNLISEKVMTQLLCKLRVHGDQQ